MSKVNDTSDKNNIDHSIQVSTTDEGGGVSTDINLKIDRLPCPENFPNEIYSPSKNSRDDVYK